MPGFPGMAAVAGLPFGNPCKRVTSVALPETSLKWTAGIKVNGTFSCSGQQHAGRKADSVLSVCAACQMAASPVHGGKRAHNISR